MEARLVISALDGGNVVYERKQTFRIVLGVAERKLYLDFSLWRAFKLNVPHVGAVQRLGIKGQFVAVEIFYEVGKSAVVFKRHGRARRQKLAHGFGIIAEEVLFFGFAVNFALVYKIYFKTFI